MKNNRPSIDGFVPRRTGSQLGELHDTHALQRVGIESTPVDRTLHSGDNVQEIVGNVRPQQAIGRTDIDESLREIDDNQPVKKPHKRQKGRIDKQLRPRSKKKRIIKWFFILLLIAVLGVGAYLGSKILFAGQTVFKGSIFDIVQSEPLKQDGNGRSNILLLGTSEDDPGHGGAYLTDSMMVVSIDQTKKNVFMFSIPRDLYVQYGMACNSGYAGKINEYFNCVNDDYKSDDAEQQRLKETQSFVGSIFGMDIQYGVHVNNTVIRDAVDAVDGVDVDIQGSNGDPGVYDRNFDWRCNYTCYLVKYDNGVHHLDGKHALFLAMARGDIAPTYGLGNSNFDREKNQQKIIVALKEKATTTGTLTNLGKVTGLIDALGKNLRTNIQTKEIQTLMKLGADIKTTDINTISLYDSDNRVVTSGPYNGASVVMPSAGIFVYDDIRQYIAQSISSDPVVREKADIIILNGSGIVGAAQVEADKLKNDKFTIQSVDTAPDGTYSAVEIYVVDDTKTGTLATLKEKYPTAVIKTTKPPVSVTGTTAFVLIIGTPAT